MRLSPTRIIPAVVGELFRLPCSRDISPPPTRSRLGSVVASYTNKVSDASPIRGMNHA